jgi:hypothetical protein
MPKVAAVTTHAREVKRGPQTVAAAGGATEVRGQLAEDVVWGARGLWTFHQAARAGFLEALQGALCQGA